jgi:hypothetical protein
MEMREQTFFFTMTALATVCMMALLIGAMLIDPWLLSGSAAMSGIAGGCAQKLQQLRAQHRRRVASVCPDPPRGFSPRGGSGRT